MITRIQSQPAQNTFKAHVDARVEEMMGKEAADFIRKTGSDSVSFSTKPIEGVETLIFAVKDKGESSICQAMPQTVKDLGARIKAQPDLLSLLENLPSLSVFTKS